MTLGQRCGSLQRSRLAGHGLAQRFVLAGERAESIGLLADRSVTALTLSRDPRLTHSYLDGYG